MCKCAYAISFYSSYSGFCEVCEFFHPALKREMGVDRLCIKVFVDFFLVEEGCVLCYYSTLLAFGID